MRHAGKVDDNPIFCIASHLEFLRRNLDALDGISDVERVEDDLASFVVKQCRSSVNAILLDLERVRNHRRRQRRISNASAD